MTEPRDLHCARCDARIELRHYDYPQYVRDHIPVIEAAAGPRDEGLDATTHAILRRFWAVPTMEGSDGHSWVRRDSVSAAIQNLPDPAEASE